MARIVSIIETTKSNIKHNRWLAASTIAVITIVFTIATFFILTAVVSQKLVAYYEKRAQLIIYFQKATDEESILALKERLNDPKKVESITYVSEADAVQKYAEYFEENPDLIESITVGTLPASLEIRAKSIDDLKSLMTYVTEEKKVNNSVEDVWYFKDVVDRIQTISKAINYGSIVLISSLGLITFFLIMITIGFNIRSHKDEIEIMHLVGSEDSFIKAPFITEGAIYGLVGGLISSAIILIPWYIVLRMWGDTETFQFIFNEANNIGLVALVKPNILYILGLIGIEVLTGVFLGSIGSSFAVIKYLNVKEK